MEDNANIKADMDVVVHNDEAKTTNETESIKETRSPEMIASDKRISEIIGEEYDSRRPTYYVRLESGIYPTNNSDCAERPVDLLEAGDDINHQTLKEIITEKYEQPVYDPQTGEVLKEDNGETKVEEVEVKSFVLDYFGNISKISEREIFSFIPHNAIEKMRNDIKNKIVLFENYPIEGVGYKDLYEVMRDPETFGFTLELLAKCINTQECDYLILPESYGFLWGGAVAPAIGKTIILARKKGKLAGELVSADYKTEYSTDTLYMHKMDLTGKKVWFVDNIFATGGTYEACKSLVEQCGGTLTGGAVIDHIFDLPENVYSVL